MFVNLFLIPFLFRRLKESLSEKALSVNKNEEQKVTNVASEEHDAVKTLQKYEKEKQILREQLETEIERIKSESRELYREIAGGRRDSYLKNLAKIAEWITTE